jgi:glyoxylase-like metal-dependent hydrolase (beta-lactamase superfamily II)
MSIQATDARAHVLQAGWTRFDHGAFECTVVTDGFLHLGPPRSTFPKADVEELDDLLIRAFLPTESIALDQNILLVNTGEQLILFDTGVGINAEFGVKTFGPLTGQAIANMRAAGIEPETIDIVALTHTHPDHCWGLVDDNDRKLFPNARIVVSRADVDYWTNLDNIQASMSDHMKDHFYGAHKNLAPYRDVISFIEDGQEIVPGIRAHATPGHSPGHTIYEISSGGQTLVCWGDLCHHQVLLLQRPDWAFLFDYDSSAAAATRVKVLDWIEKSEHQVLSYHFPFPGRGHLRRNGGGYHWLPSPIQLERA